MESDTKPPASKECWGVDSQQDDQASTVAVEAGEKRGTSVVATVQSASTPTSHTASTERASTERASTERASTERASTERASTERASTERASTERASTERASTERASTERASTERASTETESTIPYQQTSNSIAGTGQLDIGAAELPDDHDDCGDGDGGDDDDDNNNGIESLSNSAIVLKGGSGIVYWELPEGLEDYTGEEGYSEGDQAPEGGGILTKQQNKTPVSEFSESVRLLKDHSGIAFCGMPETIDDSYATLQISNLMSTVLEDIQGKNSGNYDEYEPAHRSADQDGLYSVQKPLDYLDIADHSSSDVSSREPLLVPSDNTLHVHDLPDDVMHHVFSMFAVDELCSNVSPVCQRWRRLASDPIHYQHLTVGHLSNEALCAILERAPLLKRLNLGSRDELTLDETILFSRKCPLLQELNLAFCDTLNNFLVKIITDTCSNLQQINLEGCLAVDDDSLQLLTRLPRLSRINLSHCSMVQTEGVEALATKLPRITELNIDGIPYVTDNAVMLLVKHHGRHIEKLVLDGAELSDAAIKDLTDCSVLVELKVSFAELITDVSLYHLKNFKTPLKALKLKKGSDFSTESLLDLFLSGCLSSLQSLDLSECVQLLDDGVLAMVKCCGSTLRHLSLCWCWSITDPGLDAIVDNCPLMETLELVGVHKVKGHCLVRIPTSMPHLTLLDLQQCNQVIDDLVVEVVRQLPKLVAYNYYGERFQFVSKDVLMIK